MIKFKRYLSIIILILTCSLLVACGNSDENSGQSKEQQEEINRQTEEQDTPPVQNDRHMGEYLGQIDNNSIEIKVIKDEEKPQIRAFQLSEEIKENFVDFNLKTSDQIYFDYETPEVGNPIITKIEKIE